MSLPLRRPRSTPIRNAPAAPTPPASVGVTGFGYIVGGAPALKMVGQTSMRTVTDYNFGFGRAALRIAIVAMYMAIASRPGTMPAKKSLPMSCSVMMP